MDKIVQTLGTPEMIAALEANLEEEMLCFGRGLSGGEIYNDGEIEGFTTGRGFLNGILRTHLRSQEPEYIQNRMQRAFSYFQERGVKEICWSVGADCQPTNMATYLEEYGFQERAEASVGMALDIEKLQMEEVEVAGLVIREIEDRDSLQILKKMEIESFGSSEELAQDYYEMYAGVGFGSGTVWRHFAGWQQGEAVATTSILFHAGVAGLFGVATLPDARRQGIARAMVLQALEQVRRQGYRIAVLSPTNMSDGIYRRIGFREYTRIRHYVMKW